jgi:hypothetical protein
MTLPTFVLANTQSDTIPYFHLIDMAFNKYQIKDYISAARLYTKAYDQVQAKYKAYGSIKYDASYNAACCWARAKNTDSAFKMLQIAVYKGNLTDYQMMLSDEDFNSLHGLKEWDEMVNATKLNASEHKKKLDTALVTQLRVVRRLDQEERLQLDELRKLTFSEANTKQEVELRSSIRKHDSINLSTVQSIIDLFGWLGPEKIGEQGSQTLFLVIQHADLKTQLKYLPVLREAVEKGNALPRELAFLEDRVALRQNKKQIYGSQLWTNRTLGRTFTQPVIDPDNLDKRRASVWLEPMNEYLKPFKEIWDPIEYKRILPEIEAALGKFK